MSDSEVILRLSYRHQKQRDVFSAQYLDYMVNSRKDKTCLFNENGVIEYAAIKRELRDHEGYIWRCIISLREEVAQELGYLGNEKWQFMLSQAMPNLARKMGFEIANFFWVGVTNFDRENPHAKVMFWEKVKKRISPPHVSVIILREMKELFKRQIDDEREFMKCLSDSYQDMELSVDSIFDKNGLIIL